MFVERWDVRRAPPTSARGRLRAGDRASVRQRVAAAEVEPDRRIRFAWDGYDPQQLTTVEFVFIEYANGMTCLRIVETGFTGDGGFQTVCK